MNARVKSKGVADSSKLSGPEKAAVVLLSLGEDHAGVWSMLDEEEIKVISQAMAGLGQVTSAVVEDLLVEFVSGMGGGAITGSVELTQKLLAKFMPEDKVDTLMEEIRGPAGRTMWDKLGNVNEGVLANYLKNEYPQTVAVVLSKIKSEHARACSPRFLKTSRWNASPACCAWSRCSAISSTRSSRPCAPNSCRTWRARRSATAMK